MKRFFQISGVKLGEAAIHNGQLGLAGTPPGIVAQESANHDEQIALAFALQPVKLFKLLIG